MDNYLLFAENGYAFPIMRPLQDEIRRRGGRAAWWVEPSCAEPLAEGEIRLRTLRAVKEWNPRAVFVPGNWVYDFFPGLKVQVFHGYPINKRADKADDHFKLRGWFDIYCTQGPASTAPFQQLQQAHPYFRVYETGWAKADAFFTLPPAAPAPRPAVFVGSTFSKGISALEELFPTIERLSAQRDWDWLITRHPKLVDPALNERYARLAAQRPNVAFHPDAVPPALMARTDVMLCDSSSIIVEYMLLDKPVVTLRNTTPGPHLLNVQDPAQVEAAIEQALQRPPALMAALRDYSLTLEAHRDGQNCARILDAVDDFARNCQGRIPRKPLNLFRKLQVRKHFYSMQKAQE